MPQYITRFVLTIAMLFYFISCKQHGEEKDLTNQEQQDSVSNSKDTILDIRQYYSQDIDTSYHLTGGNSIIFSTKLENNIHFFVKTLGRPDSTVFPNESETCPMGQLHYWSDSINKLSIILLGDAYTTKPDYRASSRVIAMNAKTSDNKTPVCDGIYFNMPEKELLLSFSKIFKNTIYERVRKSNKIETSMWFINKESKKYYAVLDGGYCFYFILNDKMELQTIIKSSFELISVC